MGMSYNNESLLLLEICFLQGVPEGIVEEGEGGRPIPPVQGDCPLEWLLNSR